MNRLSGKIKSYERVIKFLACEMNEYEKSHFESWLDDSPENKKEFKEIEGIWKMTGDLSLNSQVDVEKGWNSINDKIKMIKPDHVTKSSKITYRKIIFNILKIAAVFVIGFFLWNIIDQDTEWLSISSYDNDNFIHTLPDGSVVTLNAWTTIRYPEKFKKDIREIYISGEAHFEVNPDNEKSFIIKTGEALVKVVGTSFDLNAYESSDEIKIEVLTGKVLFYNNFEPGNPLAYKVDLGAGEKAVFSKLTNSITKSYNRNFWLLLP